MEKITVVIPCYNGEKYVSKCMESLLNQTLKEFKVIAVDDFSKDNTLEKLKKYEKKLNLTIIHNKENKGAAYSRNIAIKNVTTKYITFLDIDDYYEKNYLEVFLKEMEQKKASIGICDIKTIDELSKKERISPICNGIWKKENILHHSFCAASWNKVFLTEIFKNNLYPEGIINEDIPTIISAIIKEDINNIIYVKDIYYNYIQRENSVQHSKLNDKKLDLFQALDILFERVGNTQYESVIIYHQIIEFILYILQTEKNFWQRYQFSKKFCKKIKKYSLKNNSYFLEFLQKESKLHKYYYKNLVALLEKNHVLLANIWVECNHFYQNIMQTKITKQIDIKRIVKEAQKQQRKPQTDTFISVIIPNYNYENYLLERLYSVLYQKEKIGEIILLDDASTDNSKSLLEKIIKEISPYIKIQKSFSEYNSGSPYKQWQKGIDLAQGDYIWIAEADDYSKPNFLKKLIKIMKKDEQIKLAYTNSLYMNEVGKKIKNSIIPEIDIQNTHHWNNSYIISGVQEFQNYAYLNCTIANVSSAVFKKENISKYLTEAQNFKQVGDWYFYVEVMQTGKLAYYHKPLNCYRYHTGSVTTNMQKERHFMEIKKIHELFIQKYHLNHKQKEQMNLREEFLKKIWHIEEKNNRKES